MQIFSDMLMADIIHLNYLLLPVITRFDIRLGFGNKSVEEVCKEHEVDVHFFLEIVNSYHDPDYFPDKELQHFRLELLVHYLQKTHEYYLSVKIPQIESFIQALINTSNNYNKDRLGLIEKFFGEYKEELIAHIEREENLVLPYVLEVEKVFQQNSSSQQIVDKIKSYSIVKFADEHNNVEDKLYDLKNILIKFFPPFDDVFLCNNILTELFRLEKDLNNHARIEDKVLIPKVREMEKSILARQIQK